MANKLILKRSSVASKVPLATDLEPGELAVNLADQKLYSKKSDGTVILVGSGLGGAGDVQGPASSTDNALARFDGTTGKIIQNSSATLDDSGNLKVLSLTTDRHVNSTGRVLTYDFSAAPSSAVGDLDGYFDVGEALELFAFVATGDSQNYYVEGTVKIQSAASVETLFVRAAIRSDVRPQYSWSGQYERYSEANYLTCTPVFWVNETTGTGEIRLVLKFVTGNIHDIECSFKVFQRDNYGSALTVTTNHVSSAVPTNFVEYSLNKRIDLTPAGLASNVFVGALSGNAATATKLATARTIGGVSFDGTADINLPGVNAVGNQNTTGSSASCTGNAATATTATNQSGGTVNATTGVFGALTTSANSSSAALTVTQTGSGNALVVEDSANPDSTPFVIDASGNVGIGGTPDYKLDVFSGGIRVNSSARGVAGDASIYFGSTTNNYIYSGNSANIMAFAANGAERMRIDSTGNVGIGTTGGDYGRSFRMVARQDQNANTQIGVINAAVGSSAAAQFTRIGGTGNSYCDWSLVDANGSPYDVYNYGSAVQRVSWSFGGVEKLRLTSAGNLGVGTANPTQKLDVNGSIAVTGAVFTAEVEAGRGTGSVALTCNDGYGNANVAFNHRAGTPDAAGSSARITTSVDSTTASISLQLKDNVTAGTAVALPTVMSLYTGSAAIYVPTSITGSLTLSDYLRVGNGALSSYIYMSDSDNGERVIHCNSDQIGFLTQAGGWGAYCDDSGNWTAVGNVTAYSDERLKTNWRDLGEGFVARLAGVKVGVYDRIDTGETQVGVSAQSLREVMPEAVLGDETLAVAYGNAALAACVELAKEVVALRVEIEALKATK